MRSLLTVLLVLAGLCWIFPQGPPLLFAQNAGGKPPAAEGTPPQKPAGVPLRRWEHLSREEKKELEERFEHFMNLPPQKRRILEKRHQELERLRGKIEKKSEEELKNLPPAERKRIVDERVRRELMSLEKRIGAHDSPGGTSPGPGGFDEKKVEKIRRTLEARTRKLAVHRLGQLHKEGIITDEEERRVRLLPLREMVAWILDRQKKTFLQTLDGVSPSSELERFRRMPPHRFHEELKRQERERGLFGAFAMLCELTAEQKSALKSLPAGEERQRLQRFFYEENLRSRLEAMGVSRRETADILAMPLPLRIRRVKRLMKQIPPENLPPGLRDLIGGPPPRGKGRPHPPPPKEKPRGKGRPRPPPPTGKPPPVKTKIPLVP